MCKYAWMIKKIVCVKQAVTNVGLALPHALIYLASLSDLYMVVILTIRILKYPLNYIKNGRKINLLPNAANKVLCQRQIQ